MSIFFYQGTRTNQSLAILKNFNFKKRFASRNNLSEDMTSKENFFITILIN